MIEPLLVLHNVVGYEVRVNLDGIVELIDDYNDRYAKIPIACLPYIIQEFQARGGVMATHNG